MRKRIFSLALALAMCLGLAVSASAFDTGRVGQPNVISGCGCICAVDASGVLWAWGRNEFGQLGDGTTENPATPRKVMSGVASVSCGDGTPPHSRRTAPSGPGDGTNTASWATERPPTAPPPSR